MAVVVVVVVVMAVVVVVAERGGRGVCNVLCLKVLRLAFKKNYTRQPIVQLEAQADDKRP